MSELRDLTAALTCQRRRLKELIELCGREDPEHPLQQFSLRRIAWLEKQIREIKNHEELPLVVLLQTENIMVE